MVDGAEIRESAFYDDLSVERRLGVPERDQKRARDSGELRFTKKGKQILYRGSWLLEWLSADGEVRS